MTGPTLLPRPEVLSDAIRRAIISCNHVIDCNRIQLFFDPDKPGHNALNQLSGRIDEAIGAVAQQPAAPSVGEAHPDDLLTIANVSTDGGGTLTMLAASLGDLIDIVGDDAETYTVQIATMARADFEALGEFDGF